MKSFCIYILDLNQELNEIIRMVDVASTEIFPNEKLDIWIGFNGFYIKEVVDYFNYKTTKLDPIEAKKAFHKIVYIGYDKKVVEALEKVMVSDCSFYSVEEIMDKTSKTDPVLLPYKVLQSRNNLDSLLDCMNEYKGNEPVLGFIKSFIKELDLS